MNHKFSIIIPIYNAEKYLSCCIDSVLRQSFDDFECILVDDGSTDKSRFICEEYAQKDARIKVFHKENSGVSSTRNMGIDNACGEWLYFVDADDLLELDCLKNLNEQITTTTDMVVGTYKKIFVNSQTSITSIVPNQACSFEQFLTILTDIFPDFYEGYIWNKTFRKAKIDQYNLRFDEEIAYNEDRLFLVKFLCATKATIAYTEEIVYDYMIHADSAMGNLKGQFNYKYITDFAASEKIIVEILQQELSSSLQKKWNKVLVCSFYNISAQMVKSKWFDKKLLLQLFERCRHKVGVLKIFVYCVYIFLRRFYIKLNK
ncbi:MAG: glycosyltransferase [Bacteroidales bacterium]|nr:glycosyltransferase [Bacteroidales bacterium]